MEREARQGKETKRATNFGHEQTTLTYTNCHETRQERRPVSMPVSHNTLAHNFAKILLELLLNTTFIELFERRVFMKAEYLQHTVCHSESRCNNSFKKGMSGHLEQDSYLCMAINVDNNCGEYPRHVGKFGTYIVPNH